MPPGSLFCSRASAMPARSHTATRCGAGSHHRQCGRLDSHGTGPTLARRPRRHCLPLCGVRSHQPSSMRPRQHYLPRGRGRHLPCCHRRPCATGGNRRCLLPRGSLLTGRAPPLWGSSRSAPRCGGLCCRSRLVPRGLSPSGRAPSPPRLYQPRPRRGARSCLSHPSSLRPRRSWPTLRWLRRGHCTQPYATRSCYLPSCCGCWLCNAAT
mmetsp:Transcript_1202/g.2862  ORF Transcript_1202/g.2862 Transcript_1202/m.2862 type:complete len:210 (-) Transcript_1202:185-814(-)